MDLKTQQLATFEQKIVLTGLAEYAAVPNCKFIEIGSWCGESTVLLATVAKKNKGLLYCIDWWKGSVGTELTSIAEKSDVFSFFWSTIQEAGLEDVVIPIRCHSRLIADVLKPNKFDLIFIDADHRYKQILDDIKQYSPLIKMGEGIICGHDCEGRISDYSPTFLEDGKDVDIFEGVHCGVVKAVGNSFKTYSINHSIWSVKSKSNNKWLPTNLTFPGIEDKRQSPPPLLGIAGEHKLFRYGKYIYAVPSSIANYDINDDIQRNDTNIIKVETLQEIAEQFGPIDYSNIYPILLGSENGFNFVSYKGSIYAMSQDIGDVDLMSASQKEIEKYLYQQKCFVANSLSEAKYLVLQFFYDSLKKDIAEKEEIIRSLQSHIVSSSANKKTRRLK